MAFLNFRFLCFNCLYLHDVDDMSMFSLLLHKSFFKMNLLLIVFKVLITDLHSVEVKRLLLLIYIYIAINC